MSDNSLPPLKILWRLAVVATLVLLTVNVWLLARTAQLHQANSRERAFWVLCQPGFPATERQHAFSQLVSLGNKEWRSADLHELNLPAISLKGADLQGAFFVRSILAKADLSRAKFCNGSLEHADLTEANLSEADFSETQLLRADFENANLRRAKLRAASFDKSSRKR